MNAPNLKYHAQTLRYPHRGTCGLCHAAADLLGVDSDLLDSVCGECLDALRSAERSLVSGMRLRQPEVAEITALHLRTGKG